MKLPALLGLVFLLLCAPALSAAPNIIYILVDDMGYSDLGCFGGEVETPHLDALAADGVRFRQYFNGGKCEPSRAMIMTGRYWPDVGLGGERGQTLGRVMNIAGYRTLAVGKWHLGGRPTARGFDRYFGHLSGASPFFTTNDTWLLDDEPFTAGDDFYATDAKGDYAVEFIREAVTEHGDQPFFMYLAFNAPHDPLQAPAEDIARYVGKFRAGWDVLRERRVARMKEMGLLDESWPIPDRPADIPAWDSLGEEEQIFEDKRMAVYAAMIDRVDQNVGKLLAELDARGVRDDTMIVFMSDNGASPYDRVRKGEIGTAGSHWNHGLGWAHLSNTPYRLYKRQQHMGGNVTPTIVNWPNGIVEPGRFVDAPAHIIDLMPTFLDLADGAPPRGAPLPGVSLVPYLDGTAPPADRPLYFFLMDHGGLIAGDYKLVRANGGPWELYHLPTDRAETHDLAAEQPERLAELTAQFDAWLNSKNRKWSDQGDQPPYLPMDASKEDLRNAG